MWFLKESVVPYILESNPPYECVTHFVMRVRREQEQATLLTKKCVLFLWGRSGNNTFCLAIKSWKWLVVGLLVTDLMWITNSDSSNSSTNAAHTQNGGCGWRVPLLYGSRCTRHSSPLREKKAWFAEVKRYLIHQIHQTRSRYNCYTCFMEDLNLSTLPV